MEDNRGIMGKKTGPLLNQMKKNPWNRADSIRRRLKKIRALLGTLEKPLGTCSLAFSAKFPISIGLRVSDETFVKSWVIDSGAIDHMTHLSHQFKNYNSCLSSRKITIVAGIGDFQISLTHTQKCVPCSKVVH